MNILRKRSFFFAHSLRILDLGAFFGPDGLSDMVRIFATMQPVKNDYFPLLSATSFSASACCCGVMISIIFFAPLCAIL